MHFKTTSIGALLAGLLAAAAAPLAAQTLPEDPLQRQCWLQHGIERTALDAREPTSVRFTNLKTNYSVRSPFWVEFGVRGLGVIPASNPHEKAGHHHLLIDTPLPGAHREKLPFSATHMHFGKGQTGTAVTLPPGKHTLRLLFADHEHRPYFVYSPEITVNVLGSRDTTAAPVIDAERYDATCAVWYQDAVSTPRLPAKEVYVKNLRSGETVASPLVLSLGVVGWGIAPADRKLKDTGHFAYSISTRGGAVVQRQVLSDGRTEATLDLPRGDYQIELQLLGNEGEVLAKGEKLLLAVANQSR